ncbi:MAG TPA: MFS transporter, partial [Myxococcaceae bacterium]|nr:MFS transporter [Myxococcaceae bacterium]
LLYITMPGLVWASRLNPILNGIGRPFFGWVSDHLGREVTMFGAFILEGVAILLLRRYGQDPTLFVILCGFVFLCWGEIYSLFPATTADVFGRKYCTTIYGIMYTAKGMASILVPLSGYVSQRSGWSGVFVTAALLNFIAAGLALFALKPARARALNAELIPDAGGITRI